MVKFDSKKILTNMEKNSIGNEKKTKLSGIKRKTALVTSIVSLTLVFSTICGCIKDNNYNNNNMNNYNVIETTRNYDYDYNEIVVNDLMKEISSDVRFKMVLSDVDMSENYENNTVEDYKKVMDLEKEDLIGFYYLTSMSDIETEKVIQALGYEDWNDFLIKNNYVDQENKPNKAVWRNDEKQRIYNVYTNSYIK